MMQEETVPARWIDRLERYGLALLFVVAAALLRWALPEVFGPTPFLAFYLAWVGAAALGGLGPGLLATLASWLCLELLFNFTAGQSIFSDLTEMSRFLVLMAGGLTVSLVAERMRRGRIHERRQMKRLVEQADALETANEALRESEGRHRSLYHAVADGIFVMGVDGEIEDVNDSACAQLGYAREELIGLPVSAVSARPDFHLGEIIDRLRVAGSLSYETAHRRKDGVTIPVELSVVLIEYRGRPAVLGVARDITERKRAQETLRESETRLRVLSDSLPAGMVYQVDMGVDGRTRQFTYVSAGVERLHGVTAEAILRDAQLLYGQIVEADRLRVVAQEAQAQVQMTIFETETRFQLPSGEIRWRLLTSAPRRAENGHLIWDGIEVDITDRKQAEERLRESELHLARAQQIARVGSWSWDIVEDHLYCSDEAYRLFGLQPGEMPLCRAAFLGFLHPEDRPQVEKALQEALVHGRYSPEYRIILKSGEERYIHSEGQTTFDPAGHPVKMEGTVQDLTERRRAEETLRELNATLESRVAQRTAELAHRAKQLQKLTLELSQAEERERRRIAVLLHEDVQQQIAGAKFHLGLVRNRAREDRQRMDIDAVDEMLKDAIEKSRTLSHDLSPAVLHMNDLAEVLRWLAHRMLGQHGLSAWVEVSGEITLQSEPLALFLFRAAQEMLFNVVQHAGVKEATIRARRRGRYVCLRVSDPGRGFDPQILKETSGIGLFSIRERVELLGGRMKIKSGQGQGSTFSIVVPDREAVGAGPAAQTISAFPQP